MDLNYQANAGDDEPDGDHDLGTIAEIAEPELKRPPMYKVILLNDDYTPMEFVVYVLQRFFSMPDERARQIMLHVHQRDPSKVTIPYRCGRRGNPIVIPSDLRPMMLANPKSAGCREFTRENPHLVTMVDTACDGFFADVDTPEDYRNLTKVRNGAYHGKAV